MKIYYIYIYIYSSEIKVFGNDLYMTTVNPRYLDLAYLDTPLCRHNFKSPAETINFSVKNPPLSLSRPPLCRHIFNSPG